MYYMIQFAPGKPDLALQNQQVLEKEIYQFPLHKPHVAIKEACRLEVHHFMKSRAVQPRVIESISGKSSQNSVEGNTARKPVIACCGEVGGEENDEIRECPKFKTMKPKSERQAVNIIDNAEPPEIDENQGLADIRGRVERWDLNIESLADSEEVGRRLMKQIGVGRKLEEVEEVGGDLEDDNQSSRIRQHGRPPVACGDSETATLTLLDFEEKFSVNSEKVVYIHQNHLHVRIPCSSPEGGDFT
ncbi:hypothetical protein ARMGADRAFT_1034307 [Armillaria gallica]|uniref:Uncharacterized protein n=1 Tax=Armillaria gallica TaxID=47427 RepID=A0A2H3D1Q7_ARMGA|nr:hypothetical protein ARMGADRAFT_1034307 [Armillaria gallica]